MTQGCEPSRVTGRDRRIGSLREPIAYRRAARIAPWGRGFFEVDQHLEDEPSNRVRIRCAEVLVGDEAAPVREGHQAQRTVAGDLDGARCFRVGAQLFVMSREKARVVAHRR